MLFTKAGTFDLQASTGSQQVTGLGFKPKAIIFFPTINNTDGRVNDSNWGIGFAVSSSDERAMAWHSIDDGGSDTITGRGAVNDGCILQINATTPSNTAKADFTSFDDDGFTINVSDAPAATCRVGYLAFGGDELTNAKTGDITRTLAEGVGIETVTGVGFEPDVVFLMSVAGNTETGLGVDLRAAFGVFAKVAGQACIGVTDRDAELLGGVTDRIGNDIRAMSIHAVGGTTIEHDAIGLDFNSDGFKLEFLTFGTASDIHIFYLALKGVDAVVTRREALNATGDLNISNLTINPQAALVFGVGRTGNTNDTSANMEFQIGAGSISPSNVIDRFAITQQGQNAADPNDNDSVYESDLIHVNYLFTQALEGSHDLTGKGNRSITINENDADGAANELYIALFGRTKRCFLMDDFTEGSDTTLASHTPDIGGAWTLDSRTGSSVLLGVNAANDRLQVTTAVNSAYIAYKNAAEPPSADYSVCARYISGIAGDDPIFLLLRYIDIDNFYGVRLHATAASNQLLKKVGGTFTLLGSTWTLAPRRGDTVRVSAVGSTLRCFYNDRLMGSATDSDLTAKGVAAFMYGGGTEGTLSTDDVGAQIMDHFCAYEEDMLVSQWEPEDPDLLNQKTDVIGY